MRSWWGHDEVDPMLVEVVSKLERQDSTIRQSLDEVFGLPDLYPEEMRNSWNKIGRIFISDFFNDSNDDFSFFKKRFDSINTALFQIQKFEFDYSEFLIREQNNNFVRIHKNVLISERNLSVSFYILYQELIQNKSEIENLNSISKWLMTLRYNVIEFLPGKEIPQEYLLSLIDKIDKFSSEEMIDAIKSDYSSKIIESSQLEACFLTINQCVLDLRAFNQQLRSTITNFENEVIYQSIEDVEHQDIQTWLASLPETDDHWLDDCPEAKAGVEKGLAQAFQGRGQYLGSFSDYLDLDDAE